MQTSLVILSAERPGAANADRTKRLQALLDLYALPYRRVAGMYKGTKEESFVVVLPALVGMAAEVELIAASLAFGFEQESYLLVHADRTSELVFSDGTRQALDGKLRAVSPTKAAALDAYTMTEDGMYYAVV